MKYILIKLNNKKMSNDNYHNENIKNYDIIIDITSIKFLKEKGWNIIFTGDETRQDALKQIIKSTSKSIVSILGHSNRGKTYILQKISGEHLSPGYQIQTLGLSIKIPENRNMILLDTAGTNAPLLVDDNAEDPRNKPNFQKELDKINLCQIITNHIVQTFVIKEADTLICVVGMLTAGEQQFLNRVKKNCRNKKRLIVIHNLINCYSKLDIENYIKDVLNKSIINKFESRKMPSFEDKNGKLFNKYFVEKEVEGNGGQYDVVHLILANDRSENSEDIKYYNKTAIEFIRDYIDTQINKESNIIKRLREHIKDISSSVLTKELDSIIKTEDLDLIKCEEDFEPKEITADELDNITFIGKDYEPPYRYYIKENKLIIELGICSQINEKSLKCKHIFNKETNETIFKIRGDRLIKGEKELEGARIINEFINKRDNLKKFKLEFKINMKEEGIFSVDKKFNHNINYGILFLYFNINQ